MKERLQIWDKNCIGAKNIDDESVDLLICDPPFGINETSFGQLYKRDATKVIDGYQEAPEDYADFTQQWMEEGKRVLKPNGTFYVIVGHTPLPDVLLSARNLRLETLNHCIWKFNFGVNTTKKFVTSHYHILRFVKPKAITTFNTYCRFGPQEKDDNKGSLLYQDLEDVFVINRDNQPNQEKNLNKLPDKLIEKLVLYSSNPDDLICDFFMGNFTTAYVGLRLGRHVCGFEINPIACTHHIGALEKVEFGAGLKDLKQVEIIKPPNQGKKISKEEKQSILEDYLDHLSKGMLKKEAAAKLMEKYGRGPFSIKNILDSMKSSGTQNKINLMKL